MGVRSWWSGRITQPFMRPERSRSSQKAHDVADSAIRSWPWVFGFVVFVAALVTIIEFFRH
jgi:hypothetical protein